MLFTADNLSTAVNINNVLGKGRRKTATDKRTAKFEGNVYLECLKKPQKSVITRFYG